MRIARLFAAILLMGHAAPGRPAEQVVTVFAAASLTDVLEEVGGAFLSRTGIPVRFSFAASSALARQIESGAPAEVFVSADQDWMDYLAARNHIRPATRADVVTNSLVLIAPVDSRLQLRIAPGMDLAAALGRNGRIATGDTATVPAGRYAKAALSHLGIWKSVEHRMIPADNVRSALNFVALGEAPLGIVYATDALGHDRVRVIDTFPAGSHAPITYPAAATSRASADALSFLQFLRGAAAREIFTRYGFGIP